MEILIGIVAGVISGTGMGGGTFLIFLLGHLLSIEHHVAQATNLIFFIPTSIVSIIVNLKNKNIDLKLALFISFFGIIGAIFGAKMAIYMDVLSLKKYFGYFLLIISVYEIFTIKKDSIEKVYKSHNKNI